MQNSVPPIVVHGQYVKDLSFENPHAPASFGIEGDPAFQVGIDVDVNSLEENVVEVVLHCNLTASHNSETLFVVDLQYAGIFSINIDSEAEAKEAVLVQCPTILFPFVRRIVAEMVRDGGYAPLSMHPIDFADLYRQKMSQEQVETGAVN
jgi:preprotein translocase subunit SecB